MSWLPLVLRLLHIGGGEFRLDEAEGGTLLTISESGFNQVPLARRAEAFRMNEQGWAEQTRNVERHVSNA